MIGNSIRVSRLNHAPRERWGDLETEAVIAPLDIQAEVRRHGSTTKAEA